MEPLAGVERRRVVSPAVPPGWPPPPGTLAGSRTPRLVDTTDQGALAGLPERRGLRRVDAWDDRRLEASSEAAAVPSRRCGG